MLPHVCTTHQCLESLSKPVFPNSYIDHRYDGVDRVNLYFNELNNRYDHIIRPSTERRIADFRKRQDRAMNNLNDSRLRYYQNRNIERRGELIDGLQRHTIAHHRNRI
ncbi:uncharacterized protein LOC128957271 [Oppia nitens]|uniref:uncharacterized protein LOC128957271 n=1 Tax=Oppia nitens TaxID=1686743 RepID=UPI0023DB4956|nr:uncharacterized protein LOC128957271 [Oppia nitens]